MKNDTSFIFCLSLLDLYFFGPEELNLLFWERVGVGEVYRPLRVQFITEDSVYTRSEDSPFVPFPFSFPHYISENNCGVF